MRRYKELILENSTYVRERVNLSRKMDGLKL